MKLEFSLLIFEKFSGIILHENASSGTFPCERWTYMAKLIVAFLNVANAPVVPEVISI